MNDRPDQTTAEVMAVAGIDANLSALEVHYALAHRLADLGRPPKRAPKRIAREVP